MQNAMENNWENSFIDADSKKMLDSVDLVASSIYSERTQSAMKKANLSAEEFNIVREFLSYVGNISKESRDRIKQIVGISEDMSRKEKTRQWMRFSRNIMVPIRNKLFKTCELIEYEDDVNPFMINGGNIITPQYE